MFITILFLLTLRQLTSGTQITEIRRVPTFPIIEEAGMNVTLHCDLVGQNNQELKTVRWFMNGELIRQLPDPHCDQVANLEAGQHARESVKYQTRPAMTDMADYGSEVEINIASDLQYLCDVDPTQLVLQQVTREFSGNFSCSGGDSVREDVPSEAVELDILFLPGRAVISQDKTENRGLVTFLCSVEDKGNPVAGEYTWKRGSTLLPATTPTLTLDMGTLSAEPGGNISCAARSHLGTGLEGSLKLPIIETVDDHQKKPKCSISHSIGDEGAVLLCSAEDQKGVKFWWEKNQLSFDGQMRENSIESEVRLKKMKESAGTYFCHVRNADGQEFTCSIELTEALLEEEVLDDGVVFLIAVAAACIVILLLIISICMACVYCKHTTGDSSQGDLKINKSNVSLLNDDKTSTASSFYENLPFEGLQIPPKEIVDGPPCDLLDYADDDYLDTNAHGPIKYRQTSEQNATLRKKKIEERKSIRSQLL